MFFLITQITSRKVVVNPLIRLLAVAKIYLGIFVGDINDSFLTCHDMVFTSAYKCLEIVFRGWRRRTLLALPIIFIRGYLGKKKQNPRDLRILLMESTLAGKVFLNRRFGNAGVDGKLFDGDILIWALLEHNL